MRKFPLLVLVFFILIVSWLGRPGGVTGQSGQAGYVGEAACKGCHEAQYQSYLETLHSKKAVPGSPAAVHGCESCHGPAEEHVSKGGGKGGVIAFEKKEDAKLRMSQCLACHADAKTNAFWSLSRHNTRDVACDDCHSGHTGAEKNLKAAQPGLCYGCHRDIRMQANRQSHHPVDEGRLSCTSCHNPHGTFSREMIIADTPNELCYKCHAEKRGPFMTEHPPVEENCLNCHAAHGSNHRGLLTRKVPRICQSCHDFRGHPGQAWTSFETFAGTGTSKNRMFARSCLNCHANVHGSNGPSTRGSTFVR